MLLDNLPVGIGVEDMFTLQGKKLVFLRLLEDAEVFECRYLEGLSTIGDFNIRLEYHNSQTRVRTTRD